MVEATGSAAAPAKVRLPEILRLLREAHPDARCALDFENPLQLLVAVDHDMVNDHKKENENNRQRKYSDKENLKFSPRTSPMKQRDKAFYQISNSIAGSIEKDTNHDGNKEFLRINRLVAKTRTNFIQAEQRFVHL